MIKLLNLEKTITVYRQHFGAFKCRSVRVRDPGAAISFHDRGGGGDEMRGTRDQWRNEQKRLVGAEKQIRITTTLTRYAGPGKRFFKVESELAWGPGAKPRRVSKGGASWSSGFFMHLLRSEWASWGRSPRKLRDFRHLITVRRAYFDTL